MSESEDKPPDQTPEDSGILGRLRRWLREKRPDNLDQIVIALLVAAAGLLAAFVAGRASQISLTEEIPLWAAILGATVTLPVCGAFGAFLRGRYARTELEAVQREAELERQLRETLEPQAEALQRLGVYNDHFYRLLNDVVNGTISLTGFPDQVPPEFAHNFCAIPEELIAKETKVEMRASIWVEKKRRPLGRHRIQALCAPNHQQHEYEHFDVPAQKSWMFHAREQLSDEPRDQVMCIDDLSMAGLYGDDLDLFRGAGYTAVRVVGFEAGEDRGSLVILSRGELPFTQLEDRYLLLMHAALNLMGRLHVGSVN